MPKWIKPVVLIIVALSFLPLMNLYVRRASRPIVTRPSIIPDMDDQQRFKAQSVNTMFADGRSMRPQVAGTKARGQLTTDQHFYFGLVDGQPATVFPHFIPTGTGAEPQPLIIDDTLLLRGQERYNINCSVCHGYGGFGDGTVAQRLDAMQADPAADPVARLSTWVAPSNLHDEEIRNRPVGHLYNTITNGIRTMSGYGPSIDPLDRWAIVAYIRALQFSQAAGMDDVPASYKGNLEMRVKPSERVGDSTAENGGSSNPSSNGSAVEPSPDSGEVQ